MSESSRRNGRYDGTEVAICGLAGRFPGAPDVGRFWRNLLDGVESITRFSPEELREAGEDPERIDDPHYVPARPVLDGVEQFDAGFFGLSPREAEVLDPQHRVFLEVAWEALESSGYDTSRFEGAVSLFAGTSFSNYLVHNLYENRPVMESYGDMLSTIQNVPDSLATMAAYKLGLKGACCAVQTFCSTSLVAVHLACQSLLNLECDAALAGGVSIYVPQTSGYLHEEGSIVSPHGRCRAFDARADGTVFGNGVGVVVLRRLEDALKDGDDVRAVILGSATNNDGATKASFAAPAVVGQTEVVVEALASADVSPDTISCIEAHGTGTSLGDPAEVRALTKAFRTGTARRGFCALGSVKTNVGHLDAAAGVTGLIKVVLALENRQIPPSLHFETPNPEIDFPSSPFFVNTTLREWSPGDTPRRAGVSAFGVGGTNAHVVLEEAPEVEVPESARARQLLVLSARSETALEQATLDLAHHIEEHPELTLADVAWTLQVGRRGFDRRRAAVCRGREDAVRVLRGEVPARLETHTSQRRNPPVVLSFPAGEPLSSSALRELCAAEPRVRDEIDRGLDAAGSRAADLRSVLDGVTDASDDRLAAAAGLVVQHALARLVLSWGVRPEAVVADGSGERAARVVAGVVDLRLAVSTALDGSAAALSPSEPAFPLASRASLGEDPSRIVVELPPDLGAEGFLELQRSLWLGGVELDWNAVHAPERRRRVPLPTYPFERERFWVDPLPKEPPAEPGPADWLYRPFWKSTLPVAPQEKVRHLVFLDRGGLGRALAERLQALGDDVVTVQPGPSFSGDPGEGYRLDPAHAEDYARLGDDLERHGRRPESIVHAWSLDSSPTSSDIGERLEAASRLGLDSVRHLAVAMVRGDDPGLVLRVVANGLHAVLGDEQLRPEIAPLLGLLRVLPQEHEGLRCVAVDVEPASESDPARLVEALAREVRSAAADPVVALRRGGRWVQSFELLEERPESPGPVVREGGVYLVTGGLGNVGFTHAVALARAARVKLVLTGRSSLPPKETWDDWVESHDPPEATAQRIRRVRTLETLGSEVLCLSADVTDEAAMAEVLKTARDRFGALDGVVHAAGELAAETFLPAQDLSSETWARQLGPKVQGLLALDRLLADEAPGFVVLTSSLSTVLGGYGYAAYAAANAFLDAYAAARTGDGGTRWLSVGWDHWNVTPESQATGPQGLTPSQGLAAIELVLTLLDLGRVVVSVTPLAPRLQRWVALDESPAGAEGTAARGGDRPPDPITLAPDTTKVEQALLEHEAVTAAAVVAHEAGTRLEAFVTFGNGAEPTVTELRSWLKQRLPAKRAPSSFVILDALPLTTEGALDRAGLARLGQGEPENAAGGRAPGTEMEVLLAEIWQATLGREAVSVDDNFFDLGGHSLLSVRVTSRIEKELGVRLDPRDLIFQTLEQVAAACESRIEAVGKRA